MKKKIFLVAALFAVCVLPVFSQQGLIETLRTYSIDGESFLSYFKDVFVVRSGQTYQVEVRSNNPSYGVDSYQFTPITSINWDNTSYNVSIALGESGVQTLRFTGTATKTLNALTTTWQIVFTDTKGVTVQITLSHQMQVPW